MRAKIVVFALSLLASLAGAEIFLRLAGLPKTDDSTYALVPPYDDPVEEPELVFERFRTRAGARPILLLGDTYAAADNVRTYHSLPYFLFDALRNRRGAAAVFNLGRSNATTSSAARTLAAYLKSGRTPEAAVFLIGANDRFPTPTAGEPASPALLPWADVLPESPLKRLRLYQMLRHVRVQILLRADLMEHYDDDEPMLKQQERRLALLLGIRRALRDAGARDGAARLPAEHVDAIRREALRGEYDAYDITTVSGFCSFLLEFANIVYTSRSRDGEFFDLLLDLASDYPESFWSGKIEHAPRYFAQAYLQQTRMTPARLLAMLEKSAAARPELRKIPAFANFTDILKDPRKHDARVRAAAEAAWEDVARLAREKNFRVIVLGYPRARPDADRRLKTAAEKHGFAFVDNGRRFEELVEEYGVEPFIGEIDYLTPDGYKELAAGVLKAL